MVINETSEVNSIQSGTAQNPHQIHSGKRTIFMVLFGVFLLVVLLGIGLTAGYLYSSHNSNTKKHVNGISQSTNISLTPTPLPNVDSILVFQKFASNTAFASNTTTITDSAGNPITSFVANNSDSTYDTPYTNSNNYISFSSGLLASNELDINNKTSVTGYSIYESNGKTANVSPSLASIFNNANVYSFQPFIIDNTYLLGLIGSNTRDFDLTNLLNGKSKTLFTVSSLGSLLTSNSILSGQNISPDGSMVTFIVDDEMIGNHAFNSPSTVTYNINKGSFTINTIPSNIAPNTLADSNGASSAEASWDGNYLIYPVTSQSSSSMHLYNFTQKKDYTLTGVNSSISLGLNDAYFSPDNKYVIVSSGQQPWVVYSTQTGALIKNFNDIGDPQFNSLQPIGWINDTTFGYTITTTQTANSFNGLGLAYNFNVISGQSNAFSSSLGGLVAVIVKSSSQGNISVPTIVDTYTPTPSVTTTPPEANIQTVDESRWKTYTSATVNASFKYPPDWVTATPPIQPNEPSSDTISLKSPDGKVQVNWETGLSGFGGGCNSLVSVYYGGCPLVTIVSKNPIPGATGSYLVSGTFTRDGKVFQPFLAVQNADGLTTSERTMGYDMFSIGNNGAVLFSTSPSGAYAGGPSLSQQDALSYLNTPDMLTAEEIFMTLSY